MTHKLMMMTSLLLSALACTSPKPLTTAAGNPAAAGFDLAGSDPKAIAIADAVMQAQGGRQAWDATHYVGWTFFGGRTLLWDKYTGNVRIDWLKKPIKVIVNIHTGAGKVWLRGAEQFEQDTLNKYLKMGKETWINDSYWLVMPFKLKDSGVTLKYLGAANTESGAAADLLQLSFKGVGVTPDNKYHVWVDQATHLMTQWAFFEKFSDEKPRFTNAWQDYKQYGGILLSCERGRKDVNLCPIEVNNEIDPALFTKF